MVASIGFVKPCQNLISFVYVVNCSEQDSTQTCTDYNGYINVTFDYPKSVSGPMKGNDTLTEILATINLYCINKPFS